jgi:hypothetical protein
MVELKGAAKGGRVIPNRFDLPINEGKTARIRSIDSRSNSTGTGGRLR